MTNKSTHSAILSLPDTEKEKFCRGVLDLPFPAEDIVSAIQYLEHYLILLKLMLPVKTMPYWK